MDIVIVGPGRAGGSLALAAKAAGHHVVGVLSRSSNTSFGPSIEQGAAFPHADLVVIGVPDAAIEPVAALLADLVPTGCVIAHMSGFVGIRALSAVSPRASIGGFHPLQTLPDPQSGAAALAGSYVGIGGEASAVELLEELAASLHMTPFLLQDTTRALYHAAAAASSNYVIEALSVAAELYEAAGVDRSVSLPLVQQTIKNVFSSGDSALTGPIARGDFETVRGQVEAASEVSDALGTQFRMLALATAARLGVEEELRTWI